MTSLSGQQSLEGTIVSYSEGTLLISPHNTGKLPPKGAVCTISKDLTGRNVFGVQLESGWLHAAEGGFVEIRDKKLYFRITKEAEENTGKDNKGKTFTKGEKVKVMW